MCIIITKLRTSCYIEPMISRGYLKTQMVKMLSFKTPLLSETMDNFINSIIPISSTSLTL